jgi:hypothetical protein
MDGDVKGRSLRRPKRSAETSIEPVAKVSDAMAKKRSRTNVKGSKEFSCEHKFVKSFKIKEATKVLLVDPTNWYCQSCGTTADVLGI